MFLKTIMGLVAVAFSRIFQESRNLSDDAIRASNAYKNIVKAIEEAYNASLVAKDSAEQARMMVGYPCEVESRIYLCVFPYIDNHTRLLFQTHIYTVATFSKLPLTRTVT